MYTALRRRRSQCWSDHLHWLVLCAVKTALTDSHTNYTRNNVITPLWRVLGNCTTASKERDVFVWYTWLNNFSNRCETKTFLGSKYQPTDEVEKKRKRAPLLDFLYITYRYSHLVHNGVGDWWSSKCRDSKDLTVEVKRRHSKLYRITGKNTDEKSKTDIGNGRRQVGYIGYAVLNHIGLKPWNNSHWNIHHMVG